jgi:hypothetical protein
MRGKSRGGPEPPKRKRRPGEGAVSSEISQSVSSAGYSQKLIGQQVPLTELAELRAENAQRDRVTADLRRLYWPGERVVAEFILEDGELGLIAERLRQYLGRLKPDYLAAVGGDRFPPRLLCVLSRGDEP